jgi:uncharacterized protein (TIGR00251 family)
MHGLELERSNDELRLRVHVKPRASRSRVVGVRNGALDVAVAAAPVDGEANAELVRTLARAFDIKNKDLSIISGQTGRNKLVGVRGLCESELMLRLAASDRHRAKGR